MTNEPQWADDGGFERTFRIPWLTPYGYSEYKTARPLTDEDFANLLFETVSLEDSWRATYGNMSVGAEIDMNQNTPQPAQTPQQAAPSLQQGQVANSAAPSPTGYYCKNCNGDATAPKLQAKKQNRDGSWSAPVDCTNGCKNPNNQRFALSTWVPVQA